MASPALPTSTPKIHRLAEIFPPIEGADFDELCRSIKEIGLQNAIVVWRETADAQPAVIDGRNRLLACLKVGVTPVFEELEGSEDDATKYVIVQNVARRHLNESQRAMVAEGLTRIGINRERAAALMNVSSRSVVHARSVADRSPTNVIAMVKKGELAVSTASQLAHRLSRGEQEMLTDRTKAKEAAKGVVGGDSARLVKFRKAVTLLKGLEKYVEQIAREPSRADLLELRTAALKAAEVLAAVQDRLASRRDQLVQAG